MGFAAVYPHSPDPFTLYVDWMHRFVTLQWGQSVYYQQLVIDLYLQRLPVTVIYVVPGVVAATLIGSGLSTCAAVDQNSPLDIILSAISYIGLSVPAFLLAAVIVVLMPTIVPWIRIYNPSLGIWHPMNLLRLTLPTGIIALNFLAIQVRHAQTETAECLQMPYVKTAEAKGAGRFRIATHIFRNMWPSLGSLVLGESLSLLLLLTIVIEKVLKIEGIAIAIFYRFASGDPIVTFTAVFGILLIGITGTLMQDFIHILIDPRLDTDR
ncbi:ABC transporter permease subunit [Haladaptatus sp. CMAA 1911]|uniref:ABC transporter permease subunit n=1 Tax=unclassified Haladaptatus TaxID=2622732 RepID=UPI003754980A